MDYRLIKSLEGWLMGDGSGISSASPPISVSDVWNLLHQPDHSTWLMRFPRELFRASLRSEIYEGLVNFSIIKILLSMLVQQAMRTIDEC